MAHRLAYVDEVKGPASVRQGTAASFTLVGSLPDPSWELVAVEQVRDGRCVRLSPWLRRTTDEPVMQVLVPFERQVVLDKLAPGRWEVQAVGFGDGLATAALEVRP
ncbi:MAG: hypothetical protein VKS61_05560 [Candidatus Sericytochromatia bacterium]|nr:hypothetical protein [Candidatus Sericytochromatia bacterium]